MATPRRIPPKQARVFISFDYDHDSDLRVMLVGQGRHRDTPFEIADWSIKSASRTWRTEARARIRRSDIVIAICGHHTDTAVGVAEEIKIAKAEGIPVFLLKGRKDWAVKPRGCIFTKMYGWTRPNLQAMTARRA
jgi:hypothetical protein